MLCIVQLLGWLVQPDNSLGVILDKCKEEDPAVRFTNHSNNNYICIV